MIDWLLPGVKPTRKRIVVPLISVIHFDGASGKMQTWHMYWDQASVLRQAGVLPNSLYCKSNASEVVLPVLGPRIADRLKEPYNNLVTAVSGMSMEEEAEEMDNGMMPPAVSAPALRKPTSSENIFGSGQQMPMTAAAPRQASEMSNILSAAPVTGSRPSSRVIHRPGGPSSNIFNTEPEPIKSAIARAAAPFQTEDDIPAAPAARKSNRRDPNWSSLSEPAAYDDAPLPASRKANSYHSHNETHWDMAGNNNGHVAQKTGKGAYHNPNETSYEADVRRSHESGYEAPRQQFGRKMSAHAKDHGDLIGGTGYEQQQQGQAKGMVGMGKRDHNAMSEPAAERPSSKVLAPPGGKTSVFFG
ncbi:hypothetical protein BCR33DRAFT_321841 [Rhizoclosmatium globosum]|uniref:Uncharacterized protein n=1 Tax=Rhizoclosmatium globosum TaxID=329046 RepID=A0A1Y2D0C6_9FUNG|nr:hypothetical protein BCR33DRAFT_321841 [Rhizoclosmatium globosum]|eukprot:ORY52574.1 hypothetical protein BCR33DRAFT_321841 [Rhizoclosmatium globosum]